MSSRVLGKRKVFQFLDIEADVAGSEEEDDEEEEDEGEGEENGKSV